MPRGREPEGETALSNAERQARYRARRQGEQPPIVAKQPQPTRPASPGRLFWQKWQFPGLLWLTYRTRPFRRWITGREHDAPPAQQEPD